MFAAGPFIFSRGAHTGMAVHTLPGLVSWLSEKYTTFLRGLRYSYVYTWGVCENKICWLAFDSTGGGGGGGKWITCLYYMVKTM